MQDRTSDCERKIRMTWLYAYLSTLVVFVL